MYLYSVTFFTIVYFATLGLGNSDVDPFILSFNSSMMRLVEDFPTNPDDELKSKFFYTLSPNDRIKYCNEAKDFAGFDVVAPITNAPLKLLGQTYHNVLIECSTLPISYLWYDTFYKNTRIMLWENKFLLYQFEVQTTRSEPALYSESTKSTGTESTEMSAAYFLNLILSSPNLEDEHVMESRISKRMSVADLLNIIGSPGFEDKRVNDNRLSKLKTEEAIQVCIAAKRHLYQLINDSKDNAQKVPILQNDQVESAQIFDFGEEIGDHVALHCPSIPSMYVYFKNPTKRNEDLVVVLVYE